MTYLTQDQLKKLQNLSNIELTKSEQDSFLDKLDSIISKLDELDTIDVHSNIFDKSLNNENTLRALGSVADLNAQKDISQKIM